MDGWANRVCTCVCMYVCACVRACVCDWQGGVGIHITLLCLLLHIFFSQLFCRLITENTTESHNILTFTQDIYYSSTVFMACCVISLTNNLI